jgi:amino acid adenylation domain-containing protein
METLLDLIDRGAAIAGGHKIAVRSGEGGEQTLGYGDLLEGARRLATSLKEAGISAGDRVGIWMEKRPVTLQAILGVLYAGAAYVPLDPRSPWRRCKTIAMDCGMAGLIVDRSFLSSLPDLLDGWTPRLVLIGEDGRAGDADRAAAPSGARIESLAEALRATTGTDSRPTADDLAYLLYTSGSTGTPKGVVHTHRSGAAFTRWVLDRFAIRKDDVLSSHAPFHFDLSILDLYVALGAGATVHLIGTTEAMLAGYLVRKVRDWGITVWYSVPSILVAMLDGGNLERDGLGKVRLLFFAGEVFPTPQLRRLRRALPGVGLFNLFGPTETNVCTYYEVPPDIPDQATAPIPIGRACEHLETFVIDDAGKEAGPGVEGTLWARGDNLMQGYWNDAERTAITLRPDPRGRPGLAYCTGDRVRLLTGGDYQFLGRRDHMIKTRGYRVELGEIESALASHADVLEAVVVPLPDPQIGSRLVASVVSRAGRRPEPGALRAHCAERLPVYMVPERVEVRSALPRTSTGKTDRQALAREWSHKEE